MHFSTIKCSIYISITTDRNYFTGRKYDVHSNKFRNGSSFTTGFY